MKAIYCSFNLAKFIINETLFIQSLNKYLWYKTNSLPGSKIWYLVTILTDSVQNGLNSLWQTEYCSYLTTGARVCIHKTSEEWVTTILIFFYLAIKVFFTKLMKFERLQNSAKIFWKQFYEITELWMIFCDVFKTITFLEIWDL